MKKILKGIYKFVDKFIVVPISRIVYYLNKKSKKSQGLLDKVLNKPNFLVYLSLILAVVMFLLIDSKVISLVETEAEVITNVPVKVKYNEEAYVIEGVPETVDITLIGSKTDLFIAKQMPSPDIVVDLTSLGVGKHEVEIKYNQSVGNLKYMINPSTVTVEIFEKKKIPETHLLLIY